MSREADRAAEDLRALLSRTVAELQRREAPDQALAELRQPRGFLGVRRKPVMAPLGRAWRLGVLLLDADARLYTLGSVTRAVEPLHANNQSESQELRREIRRAAFAGPFPEGDIVNYGWRPLRTDAEGLAADPDPLALRGDRVLVRWAPGPASRAPGDAGLVPLDDYLAERIGLLDGA